MKKNLIVLPIVGLILGAVAIATEIKTTDFSPLGQELSGSTITCIKTAVDAKETAFIASTTIYQHEYIQALTAKKTAVLAAWDKTTKKEVKSALGQASKIYKNTLKTLRKTLKTSEQSIRTTYKMDTKTCKSIGLQELIDVPFEE